MCVGLCITLIYFQKWKTILTSFAEVFKGRGNKKKTTSKAKQTAGHHPGYAGVCVFVWELCLYAGPGWGLWCLYLGSGFGFHPVIPGWGLGVCVSLCALRLYPLNPGWGVRCGCVCLGSRFSCAPPFLGWGVGVCMFVCVLRLFLAIAG